MLTNLSVLDFGDNELTGTIPTQFGAMSNLAGLSFFKNDLTGSVPTELGNIDGLDMLYLDSNKFAGPISESICVLELSEFWSDCEEVECVCCTTCVSLSFNFLKKESIERGIFSRI